jgi:hypothetical protein
LLLKHNGLHIELVIDPRIRSARTIRPGLADVLLESALTTIIDWKIRSLRSMPRTRSRRTPTGWA